MPDKSAQAELTAVNVSAEVRCEMSDESIVPDLVMGVPEDEEVGARAEGETDLSNKNNWPAFPHNYWKDLHDAHHNWKYLEGVKNRHRGP